MAQVHIQNAVFVWADFKVLQYHVLQCNGSLTRTVINTKLQNINLNWLSNRVDRNRNNLSLRSKWTISSWRRHRYPLHASFVPHILLRDRHPRSLRLMRSARFMFIMDRISGRKPILQLGSSNCLTSGPTGQAALLGPNSFWKYGGTVTNLGYFRIKTWKMDCIN